jgi:miniconductance mechanosensitive channel
MTTEYVASLFEYFCKWLGSWSVMAKPILVFAVLFLAWLLDLLCRKVIIPGVRKVVEKTSIEWDDILLNSDVLGKLSHLLPAALVANLLPMAFFDNPLLEVTITKVTEVYMIIAILRFILSLVKSVYCITEVKNHTGTRPLKGIFQMVQVLVICVGIILVFSVLFGKSPLELLVGLGAAATVLMLIFKDTIVGLVSGVQLSANDMLRKGDWIALPKHGVDGRVEEVNLTTVKVRNWDKTIYTIPPYTLVSEVFQNWRGMEKDSEGRRVKRHLKLDMNSVRLCTPDEMRLFAKEGLVKDEELQVGVPNSTVFRRYLQKYLGSLPSVNSNMTLMVRQLQPTEHGLPLELYFFTASKVWTEHETAQADILDAVIAAMPRFGLRVFQSPSGVDFRTEK